MWQLSIFVTLMVASTIINGLSKSAVNRVAIIGGGFAGTSAAFFMNKACGQDLQIDILEKTDRLGGRIRVTKVDGHDYEVGGSIIHSRNYYAKYLAKTFGLKPRGVLDGSSEHDDVIGLYDGSEFVFTESRYSWITALKAFSRYGWSIFQHQKLISKLLDSFERIYELQDKGMSFQALDEMLLQMDPIFLELKNTTLEDYLEKTGFSRKYIEEVVRAIILVNYGQDEKVPALVGSIGMAGAGANLWAVEGGNWQLAKLMGEHSKANIIYNSKVNAIKFKSIDSQEKPVFIVEVDGVGREYDAVIIATPLNMAKIKLEGIGLPDALYKFDKYHQTVATIIQGELNEVFDGYDVLSCNASTLIKSLSRLGPVDGAPRTNVFKVFSGNRMDEQLLNSLFKKVNYAETFVWKAYPEYLPINLPRLTQFILTEGVFYTNAIEWAASAMEMSLISGRNAALNTCKYLKKSILTPNNLKINEDPTLSEMNLASSERTDL